jgi:7-cyano-7-deazaguanine synthase
LPIRLKYLAKSNLYKQMKSVVVSLSGGMDSSTLLLRALSEYDNVVAVSFDYGQKHKVELERAQELVQYVNETKFRQKPVRDRGAGFKKDFPVKYRVIKLDGLTELLQSALITEGEEVPEGYYAEQNQKATVVPNRNKIFSSIVQAIALSIANQTQSQTDIALGIHAGDHEIYPDCRQEFRDADDHAFRVGNWEAERVGFFTPYLNTDKFGILKDGQRLCQDLGLEFNEVYRRTNTSYKPYPSGNSDYKSASSVERILAFNQLGIEDPVQYEDETGLVSWEIARAHAVKVEAEFLKRV